MYEVNKEAIERIKEVFMEELDDRGYEYKQHAIDEIFNEWLSQKQMLINILSKHPNWDAEHFMVHFNEDYSREIDLRKAENFVDWLEHNTPIHEIKYVEEDELFMHTFRLDRTINMLCHCQYISEDYDLTELNKYNEAFNFRYGMKCTKIMGQICKTYGWDKLPDYNKEYAKYCDALSPIKLTRHTCLSVNPIDYLLMSNGNSWKSCHYIGDHPSHSGCYSSGTISYMLDQNSMIFYTVGADFCGNYIETEQKIQRQVFGYNDFQLTQSRLYPQSNDYGSNDIYKEIRNTVQKVISDCLEKPNLWVKRKVFNTESGNGSTCYHDWSCGGSLYSTSILKEAVDKDDLDPIVFGAMPICITCGNRHLNTENISCCASKFVCAHCGHSIDEADAVFIYGECYCTECANWCDWCESWHAPGDGQWLASEGMFVCDYCLYESGDFTRCEVCGKYHRDNNTQFVASEDKYVCDDCINEFYDHCDECGEWFAAIDMVHVQDPEYGFINCYCKACHSKIEKEKENE